MGELDRLKDRLKFLELSVDNIADAVYWITMDGCFRNVNAAACEMLGYNREEFLSMSVHDIAPDYTREEGRSDLADLMRTGTMHLKTRHTTKDGRVIPVDIVSKFFVYNGVEYICCTARDISEQVKAEKEASFFKILVEHTHDPIHVISHTRGARLVYVNEATCRHFGREREELLGMCLPDFDPAFDMERLNAIQAELKEKKVHRHEMLHRVASGDLIPVEVASNYLELDGEELAVGYFHDISRRKAMEAVLQKSHEELEKRVEERTAELTETVRALRFTQFAIDRAEDQAFWMTEDGRFFYVNDAACRALGYSREELSGMSVPEINPTCSPEDFPLFWNESREKGSIIFETSHRAKDGRVYPVEIRTNNVIFEGKEYTCAFATDITERKRMEEALRASEAEKSLILNSTMDNITYHGPDMRIVWVNRKLAELAKLPAEELVGRHCWEVFHGQKKPCEDCPVILARDSGDPQIMEKHHIDGSVLYMRAYPIKSDDGKLLGIAKFVSDITERKKAEEALRKAHDELECRVRERTGQLTSLAAELSLAEERERRRIATDLHDHVGQTLILSKIKLDTLADLLQTGSLINLAGEIREHLDRSIEEIRSLTFQLSPPLLYEVGFEAAVEWLGEEFGEKYGFVVDFQDDGKKSLSDEETSISLYQMVRELLVNVARHAQAKRVKISVEKIAGRIRIGVADDGSGFDCRNGMLNKGRKSGFGLFNIRQRIEYMGGKIKIGSEINRGTRVTLELPLGDYKRRRKR